MSTPLSVLLFLTACWQDPTAGTLSQNVGQAFAPCSEAEIRYLASKHNFMTSFRPCGNNHFQDFEWSPDGRKLYFQLGTLHHIMDAESPNKDTRVVPTPSPVGPGGWVSSTRLVVPVSPPVDAPDGPPQLALYDTDQASVFTLDLPTTWTEIRDVQRDDDPGKVLLSAVEGGIRRAYRVDLSDGSLAPAFSWLGAVDRFDVTHEQQVVVVGYEGTASIHDIETGEVSGRWSPAIRGTVHRDGRWLMLEHEGDPVSIFYQRAWDELSEQAREREQRRAQRFQERLPDSFETEVMPPTLSFVDLPTGRRYQIDSVHGHEFEWYGPTPFYGSFLLWGFEGKQFKRNVLLGDFTGRMTSAAAGGTFIGVVPFPGEETDANVAEGAMGGDDPPQVAPPEDGGPDTPPGEDNPRAAPE